MAKLNPVLIESMTNDLEELHIICKTMLTFTEEYNVISWKFPDRFCKDVDISIDKDEYDEVEQYILLLELTIDRLYFIINISIHIVDSLPILSKVVGDFYNYHIANDVSLGILINLFWKRLQILMYLNESPIVQTKTNDVNLEHKYSQTESCSLLTCESCHMFMEMMKMLINTIEQSTIIVDSKSAISDTRITMATDLPKITQLKAMQQWIDAVITDIDTLTETFQKHSTENKVFHENIDKMRNQKQTISKKFNDLKSKYCTLEETLKSNELKLSAHSKSHSILELKYNTEHDILLSLQTAHENDVLHINELNNQINKINTEKDKLLCDTKMEHLNKMETLTNQRDHWAGLYASNLTYTEELESKFHELEANYQNLNKTYDKDILEERNRIKESSKKFDEQEKMYIDKISKLESEISKQKNEYKEIIENLKKDLEKMKDELETSKERELCLIKSPDLNGPLTYSSATKLDPISDMENQMKSNQIRIEVLQTQNSNLQRTVDKLRLLSTQNTEK